ncbi:MAG: PLDc_N domain-containing protein [Rhodospirillaceae bacterium]|nr:PLDc_N domain-containing protein [Rhodospirillaceae bacterium]MBT6118827.1 PLDc_N domain-containing protein [Rhodospirillaceae bacterium]
MEAGLIGLLLFVLWLWAVISILQSNASGGGKLLWILIVVIFPFVGFVIWLFIGPRSAR